MHIVNRVLTQIKIDNKPNIRYVQPSWGQVRADQYLGLEVFELHDISHTPFHLHDRVQLGNLVFESSEGLGNEVAAMDFWAENDALLMGLGLVDLLFKKVE